MSNDKIYINYKWWNKWQDLSRNQILLAILSLKDYEMNEVYIDRIYDKKSRYLNDKKVIDDIMNNDILFNYNDKEHQDVLKDMNVILDYRTLKRVTLEKAIDEKLTKRELLTMLWIIDVYHIKQDRVRTFSLQEVINHIFSKTARPNLRTSKFKQALTKFSNWKYEDGKTIFLKSYEILKKKNLTIYLDEKTHKTIPKKYRKYAKK